MCQTSELAILLNSITTLFAFDLRQSYNEKLIQDNMTPGNFLNNVSEVVDILSSSL